VNYRASGRLQGGTVLAPGEVHDTAVCERISQLLARVGDNWTVLVVGMLGNGPMRFNSLRRQVGDISQKMLATTLRALERDGFVSRRVLPTNPPQVEYALTELGRSLLVPVTALVDWTRTNSERIESARRSYAAREPAPAASASPARASAVVALRPAGSTASAAAGAHARTSG